MENVVANTAKDAAKKLPYLTLDAFASLSTSFGTPLRYRYRKQSLRKAPSISKTQGYVLT